MCDLPSFGSEDARRAFMGNVSLRDEGSQFGNVDGRGTNAKHAMTEGAESTEGMQRRSNKTVSAGKEEDA